MDEIAVVVASLPALRFESFALHSPGAAGLKVSNLPDPATNVCGEMMSLDARTGGFAMRRDELLKPDRFSEVLLLLVGAALFVVLASTLWLAVFTH